MAGKLRVVLDTNIFISALFGGNPEEVLRAALTGRFQLVTSPAILTELAGKLREKFALPEPDITQYVHLVGSHADIVRPRGRIRVVEDEPDNRVLECAKGGGGRIIVSGDRHLLSLGEYEGIPVMRPMDFLRRLERT